MARGRRVRRRLVGRGDLLAWPWSLRRRHRGDRGLRGDGCPWLRPLCPRPPGTSVCCPLDLGKYSSFRGASVRGPSARVTRLHTHAHHTRALSGSSAPCSLRGRGPPGTASEWLAHLADPLSGRPVSTWQELGRWKVPEAAASQGSAGRQQEASLEQPRAPRAGSAGQTPVPVGSRGASPARGRGCGIVTHGGWGTGSRAGWQLPLLRLFQPRRGRDRVAPGAAPHPHPHSPGPARAAPLHGSCPQLPATRGPSQPRVQGLRRWAPARLPPRKTPECGRHSGRPGKSLSHKWTNETDYFDYRH